MFNRKKWNRGKTYHSPCDKNSSFKCNKALEITPFSFLFLLFLCSIHQFSKFSNICIRFFYLRWASWCCCQLQEAEHLPEHCCVCAGPQRHWAWAALCQWYSRYAHSSLTLNKKKQKQRWVKQHSIFNNTLSYFFTHQILSTTWRCENVTTSKHSKVQNK